MSEDYDEEFVGCETWTAMTTWLAESLPEVPAGVTIDFGPKDLRIDDEPLDAAAFEPGAFDTDPFGADPLDALCAQIVVLEHGRYLVRRSRVLMEATNFVSYDATGASVNLWFDEPPTSDCTDGAVYVDDAALAAEICVTWLASESGGGTPNDFGFDVTEAIGLPGLGESASPWTLDDFLRRLGH